MENEVLNQFLQSDGLLFQLTETIHEEMDTDDEPFEKVARNLLLIYSEHPKVVNDVLIALCGWSIDSLITKI